METITFTREIPVTKQVDVFIAGGGPAGIAAAVTASRMGVRVFLAEKGQCLGGAATLAGVPAFMRFSDGVHFLAGGIGREVFDAMYGPDTDDTAVEYPVYTEKLKLFYDRLVSESGCELLFDTQFMDVQADRGRIHCVILKGHENLFAVKAHTYIDCTGDGTLAVKAGARWEKGDSQGRMMPATLCTLWNGIDWNRAIAELGKDPDARMLDQAFRDGVFTLPDPSLPGMWKLRGSLGGGNIGHVFGIDGTDEEQLTKGILDARRRMTEYVTYYTHYLEGYEKADAISSASVLGIRETRRILGEYVLSVADYEKHAVFSDEIGRYCYPIDLHAVTPDAAKTAFDEAYQKGYGKGNSYGIPYRCLLPQNTDNLLVAGRCISTTREMNGSTRVMPCCFITGMAAGAAGALAGKGSLRELPVDTLRNALREQGAYLP
nr:FAD-dependent oxidoreductase [uncultured Eisenbergiella sp.]